MMPAHAILVVVAFLTATLSGILGMGGGALLLAALSSFLSHAETIPMHASVQLVSNSTRVVAFVRHVDWRTVARFSLGALPGAAAGGVLLWVAGPAAASEPYLKGTIGVYILVLTFLPKRSRAETDGRAWEWTGMGLAAGVMGIIVGAVGPLIAPLFARHSFVKERLIATKAVCQAVLHVIKLPVFILVRDFEPTKFTVLLVAMIAVSVPGTLLGKWLLRYVSGSAFVVLYKVALVVAGCKLLAFDCVIPLWSGSTT